MLKRFFLNLSGDKDLKGLSDMRPGYLLHYSFQDRGTELFS